MTASMLLVSAALALQVPQVPQGQGGARSVSAHVAVAPAPTGIVEGQVMSGINGAPLPFAAVEVLGGDAAAVTDGRGRYVLAGVTAGRHMLRATHLGHAPLQVAVTVPAGGVLSLDFALELRPVALPAVTALAGRPSGFMDSTEVPQPDLGEASVRALESTPGMVELGLGDVAQGSPAQDPIDPTDVLYVRGAAADLKLVLLDGAPVYAPFHLGGLVAPFEADLLRSARLYVGGAPARYDGGISYVLDMQTRGARGDRVHTLVNADLLSARARVEGPMGLDAGYLVSARTVHGLGATGFKGSSFPYGYVDGLVRLDRNVVGSGTISATGFMNRESVRLQPGAARRSTAAWGNSAGSVRYMGPFAGGDAELTVAAGRFAAGLPIIGDRELWVDGAATRARVAADILRSAGPAELDVGFAYEREWLDYRSWSRGTFPDSLINENEVNGDVAGGYVDASWQASSRLRFRGGMRVDVFSAERAPYIAPRLLATFLVTDNTALTLAAGQYHQYVRAPEAVLTSPDADQESTPTAIPERNPLLAVAGASHIVLSLDQQLAQGVRLGVEGFHKIYDGIPTDPDGHAQASGVDFWIRRGGGSIQGWLGYSLAWLWSNDAQRPAVDEIFSGRHLVSAGVQGSAGDAGRFQLRVTYGAGLPYTAIQPGGPSEPAGHSPAVNLVPSATTGAVDPSTLVASPDEPYLRLDGEISHTWLVHWLGSSTLVTPYLRVLNALNRRDALFYHFDGSDTTSPRALAALPVVPVVGVGMQF